MYTITRMNRGRKVIEWRHMPSEKTSSVRKLLKTIFNQDNMLSVATIVAGTAFILEYFT